MITNNPDNWKSFLKSACRNHKLRFDEQLLIYAQRPDATAVLEIENWNKSFGRWVNRGAKGIAVFEDIVKQNQRLIYYFDISDTHAGQYSRPVPLWSMKEGLEESLIETLENTFGTLEHKNTLDEAIISASINAAEDNISDYLDDLLYVSGESLLNDFDKSAIANMYKSLVADSMAYMIMSRLELDTELYFDDDSFRNIINFNTHDTINCLGIASSDIAQMGLTEIARTIRTADRQNRTFEKTSEKLYTKDEENSERSFDYERSNLHNDGRLQSARSETSKTTGGSAGTLRTNEKQLSEETSQDNVLQLPDSWNTNRASGGNSAESRTVGTDVNVTDVSEGRLDGTDESDRADEMGGTDEQSETVGTGNSNKADNIQLEYYDRNNEDKSIPFLCNDDVIKGILLSTPHLKASKEEIKAFFVANREKSEQTEYVKNIFNNDYTELVLDNGNRVGYKTYQNVLQLWEGSYLNRTSQGFYNWSVIAAYFESMRLLGELYDISKPLPSIEGQQTLIIGHEAEEKTSAFVFSQEIIDTILCRGSDYVEGKMRIYEIFQKSLSAKERTDFLKKEYGIGGVYPVLVGTKISCDYSAKGIELSKGFTENRLLLSWTKVEKRISELVKLDRYLSAKEKEKYPEWLEQQIIRRAEIEAANKNREILSQAPKDVNENSELIGKELTLDNRKFVVESISKISGDVSLRDVTFQETVGLPINRVEKLERIIELLAENSEQYKYEYHLGDTVYIGANEYEIISLDNNRVLLFDKDAPLIEKELSRDEFEKRAEENPYNDHLKVRIDSEEIKFDETTENIQSYTDAFFVNKDNETVTWIYYNPDSDAGGQYVTNQLSFTSVNKGAENYKTTDEFFDYLSSVANQTLADVGSEWFEATKSQFLQQPDYTDCSEQTMSALIDIASKEKIAEVITPSWEKKKVKRVSSYNLYPDIPMSERNNFNLRENKVEEVGKKERYKRNIEAIKVLKKCEAEERFATSEEQLVLSKYVGWGGIPEAFDENNSSWSTELSQLLSSDEYSSARESTLTAFFTPPEVITAIYKALEQMGFKDGNILEPSCGIGNFMGMLPASMQSSKIYGVELDKISAGIAQQLYQKYSVASQGFEEVSLPDSFFDSVIGNVPFGDFKVYDKRYDKHKFLIHDYFMAKSLDKLRPNGIMAVITSKGTMDKENSSVRKYLSQRADLLGAIRLPNNAFKENAGTEVTSDILFFQKRDRITDIEPDWVHLDTDANGIKMNSYFVNNPDMILGEMKMVSGRFGMESACVPFEDTSLEQQLSEAIVNIHGEVIEYEAEEIDEEDVSIPANPDVRNFSYTTVDALASTFAETVTAVELTPEGTGYRAKTRFAKFILKILKYFIEYDIIKFRKGDILMFYELQPKDERENYKKMLTIIGNLTLLFSESKSPYLPYRCHENIFCKYLKAVNLARSDCSADAMKNYIGIGLKTWMGNDDQKVAEFGKLRDTYSGLTGLQLVKKISEYRNERIRVTKNTYGITEMIYHIVKRIPGAMQILEHTFDYIDIDNIKLILGRGNVNNTYFTDGKHTYHFSTSKNTLYMIFEDMKLLDTFEVEIMADPYSFLMNSFAIKTAVIPQQKEIDYSNKLCLRLYSTNSDGTNFVGEKSGLNQWNAGGRERNDDELYIPYLREDRDHSPDFFPPRDTVFNLILPDGTNISAKVCQAAFKKMPDEEYERLSAEDKLIEDKRRNTGKAIMSNPNKVLGNWILRKVFELPPKTIVTYEMLKIFGIDSVIFTKIDNTNYSVDFATLGTYEKFYGIEPLD